MRRLDAQLDRIPFSHLTIGDDDGEFTSQGASDLDSPRVKNLLRLIKTLSTSSGSQSRLPAWQLQSLLTQSNLLSVERGDTFTVNHYESELEWLLVGKATVQTYGVILDTLLDQITPLSNHIWYWDEVLSSPTYGTFYMVQTSPCRLWTWTLEVYEESKARLQHYTQGRLSAESTENEQTEETQTIRLSQRWHRFYAIVRESIRERSLANVQRRIMSPVALARAEARNKQDQLRKLREMMASSLGVLIDEALMFESQKTDEKSDLIMSTAHEWRGVVERSVALMDIVLRDVLALDVDTAEFEDKVFVGVDEDPELSTPPAEDETSRPAIVARRLHQLLTKHVPEHTAAVKSLVAENGRPSKIVRYWLPATAILLSSSTILRVVVNRQQDIIQWIQDFGATVRDFWFNWVVEPIRKVVGTIRHDSNGEIAIMSRDSLRADRDSLERMVVDFALDRPMVATGVSSLSESQVAEIRAKVKEGDVSPVLRAYEKDLRSPLKGTVRGDLVRTLLIQVQKTKVDVEVAMSGIDALLKSQELVFGFVGLTPGILVSIGVVRYLREALGGRKGLNKNRRARRCVRVLRNIDRILSEALASPTENDVLQYKDHGMLISEIHVLRRLARKLLPAEIEKEFLEDMDDLANLKGIGSQIRALDRIRWAYSKWLA